MNTLPLGVRVASKRIEAQDICTFELVSADGSVLPAFSAGSHIDVAVPNGLTRQYSLCNDPTDRHHYQIGVLRDPSSRGGSKAMHDLVKEGDSLRISAPKNNFPLVHGARRHVLLAGGIGVTPILCMAERLAAVGEAFEMHYCTRSPARTAFRERIGTSSFASKVRFYFDDDARSPKLDIVELSGCRRADTHVYVCGPIGFMDWVLNSLRSFGWSQDQLHTEYFASEVKPLDGDGSFEVQLASSGRIVLVPKGKTVLAALSDAGVEVPFSCEQGVCGTCVTRVLEGEPDHRDMFFTPDEQSANDQFTPCCSRSKSPRLVLDI